MDREELIDALEIELTRRGVKYRSADVFGFVVAGWDQHDTGNIPVKEWADDFIEAKGVKHGE